MTFARILTIGLIALLAACAEIPKPGPLKPLPPPPPGRAMSDLPGFEAADLFVAFEAVRATCQYKKGTTYEAVCEELKGRKFDTQQELKAFFLTRFRMEPIEGEGLLTAYFVPEYPATTVPDEVFAQPIRTRPKDLVIVDGALVLPPQPGKKVSARKVDEVYLPYYSRAEIEAMPSDSKFFMKPEDYFFMQLQGSGYLTLPDRSQRHATYDGDNGLPFVGIAKPMVERGLLKPEQSSGENIRSWLADHRGPEAREIMNLNPRYAFFRIDESIREPFGAANVTLPPQASIAVDPNFHPYGELLWIDGKAATLSGAFPVYQQLVAALDTGGAIKGNIRADLYMGRGARAGQEAGRVKHKLKMWRIVPLE